MDFNLIYMPTFRVRQQEIIVLKSFDFGNNSYPLLEIVKEHDRARKDDSQKSFGDIHNELINEIKAPHVFIDLPIYIKQSGAVKDEVVSFMNELGFNKQVVVSEIFHPFISGQLIQQDILFLK